MNKKTEFLRDVILKQREFIQYCENNPKSSYFGPNARAIRDADRLALMRFEERLAPMSV